MTLVVVVESEGTSAMVCGAAAAAVSQGKDAAGVPRPLLNPLVTGGKAGVPPPCREGVALLSPPCTGEGRVSQPLPPPKGARVENDVRHYLLLFLFF